MLLLGFGGCGGNCGRSNDCGCNSDCGRGNNDCGCGSGRGDRSGNNNRRECACAREAVREAKEDVREALRDVREAREREQAVCDGPGMVPPPWKEYPSMPRRDMERDDDCGCNN